MEAEKDGGEAREPEKENDDDKPRSAAAEPTHKPKPANPFAKRTFA